VAPAGILVEVRAALSGPAASSPELAARNDGCGARLLIVDDNEDATDLLTEALRDAGYAIIAAYDGPTALRLAAASPPDVALIDIGLPEMDGYELARRLRELWPASALRLIALTGYGQERDRGRGRRVGFERHLVKPVDLDTLLRAIEADAPPE
jgi:DNA-binding response OmpR family regulator